MELHSNYLKTHICSASLSKHVFHISQTYQYKDLGNITYLGRELLLLLLFQGLLSLMLPPNIFAYRLQNWEHTQQSSTTLALHTTDITFILTGIDPWTTIEEMIIIISYMSPQDYLAVPSFAFNILCKHNFSLIHNTKG